MNELTGADILRLRDELERDSASALGETMFAFSGLDMNLGLMVASTLRNTGRETQVPKADAMNFHLRLEFIQNHIESDSSLPSKAKEEMKQWVTDAHRARIERNQLVHGRWSTDPLKGKALNIVGLPSSDAQQIFEYTVEELRAVAQGFIKLNSRLSKARMRWHLP
jgi:hypothetical protein